jgi:TetR/AcrR family transcriptional repressor of nem operon
MNTKQQIVAYSADMLRTRGFNGFSYLDISRELGITKASVHHHFPKKQDLGLALCAWTEEWLVKGFKHFEEHGTSEWDKLQRYGRGASKHCLSEQMMCPISALHSDLNRLPLEMQQALKVLDNTELDWVSGVLQAGIDSAEFTPTDDPRGLASVFIYSCKGALYYDRLHGKELFQQTMQQFERLIKA